ncbi:Fe-S cluster assembly protein HesB [Sporosarcina sp. Te-1]|uniref:Fe-S cluster assembly protein HesB n=1 Tax=Sporosarcina sp. Te-1 TaxID=2818390 RepID=UPI001A9F05EA|nr:Fe-S cluster assembly protein HesB [Sporosarcina sp. Te-1]QTD42631.1 Fe-S cluster assembly protein HesB [Sporosarcina sp. Te-1]
MNLSPEGKDYLTQVLAAEENKIIHFYGVQSCCGTNIGVELVEPSKKDEIIEIDNILFLIDKQVSSTLDKVTIHAEKESRELGLVLLGLAPVNC